MFDAYKEFDWFDFEDLSFRYLIFIFINQFNQLQVFPAKINNLI
jgi:hypothetical protein